MLPTSRHVLVLSCPTGVGLVVVSRSLQAASPDTATHAPRRQLQLTQPRCSKAPRDLASCFSSTPRRLRDGKPIPSHLCCLLRCCMRRRRCRRTPPPPENDRRSAPAFECSPSRKLLASPLLSASSWGVVGASSVLVLLLPHPAVHTPPDAAPSPLPSCTLSVAPCPCTRPPGALAPGLLPSVLSRLVVLLQLKASSGPRNRARYSVECAYIYLFFFTEARHSLPRGCDGASGLLAPCWAMGAGGALWPCWALGTGRQFARWQFARRHCLGSVPVPPQDACGEN